MKAQTLVFLAAFTSVSGIMGQQPAVRVPGAPKTLQVCFRGNVAKPAIVSYERDITLLQALERVGGTLPNQKLGARVYRHVPNSNREEWILISELKKIQRGRAPDLPLLPSDVVEVFARNGKQRAPNSQFVDPCASWLPKVGLL